MPATHNGFFGKKGLIIGIISEITEKICKNRAEQATEPHFFVSFVLSFRCDALNSCCQSLETKEIVEVLKCR